MLSFVLARAGRLFLRNGLPMLVGMAAAFTAVATLAAATRGSGRRSHFEIRFLDPGVQAYAFTSG